MSAASQKWLPLTDECSMEWHIWERLESFLDVHGFAMPVGLYVVGKGHVAPVVEHRGIDQDSTDYRLDGMTILRVHHDTDGTDDGGSRTSILSVEVRSAK